jgi:hypothetical protein
MPAHTVHSLHAFLLALLALLCGGCATTRLTPAEKMMWSTYVIASPKGLATCVIVNRKDPSAPEGVLPVLVTAAHVLTVAPHGPFYLIYRTPRPANSPEANILEFDAPEKTEYPFFKHPHYDVAALELRLPPDIASEVTLPSFLNEEAISSRGNEPLAGEDVSILGFPSVLPGTEGAFPILRAGRVASFSAGPSSDRQTFLVNTNVYSGDSGGPVFRSSGRGKPKMVGILTERIGKKEGGVPLAIAINSSVVSETLMLEAAQQRSSFDKMLGLSAASSHNRYPENVRLLGPAVTLRKLLRKYQHRGREQR